MWNPNNLTPFANPGVHYMEPREVSELAQDMAQYVTPSSRIISVDSGARPLANLIARQRNSAVLPIKVGRVVDANLISSLRLLLTTGELHAPLRSKAHHPLLKNLGLHEDLTLSEALSIAATALISTTPLADLETGITSYEWARVLPSVPIFNTLLSDTDIAKTLRQSPYLVEEYITGATVLTVLNTLFAHITSDFSYHLVCYNLNKGLRQLPTYLDYAHIIGSPKDIVAAYPFENRIDLLGFYYVSDPELHSVDLTYQTPGCSPYAAVWEKFDDLLAAMTPSTELVRTHLSDQRLRDFVDPLHSTLFTLSKVSGVPAIAQFFNHLFEMYAPAWSPLPNNLHIDFIAAFESVDPSFFAEYLYTLPENTRSLVTSSNAAAAWGFELTKSHHEYWDHFPYPGY